MGEAKQLDRMVALDGQRGLIMVVMALDHASLFIAIQHWGEYWGIPLPDYGDALSTFTRVISHLCAPGFFFLMGAGMHLFASSRRDRGWTEAQIRRHFVTRGLVLIVVELFVVNLAFGLGMMESFLAGDDSIAGVTPGGGSQGFIPLGVLAALGAAMVIAGFLIRLGAVATLGLGLATLAACSALLPSPANAFEVYPALYHLLLIAGHADFLIVAYPIAPWLGVCLVGIAYGHALRQDSPRTLRLTGPVGLVLLVLFVFVRAAGGFGTYHATPGDDWIAFLTLTKYPPSLAFLLLSLGTNGVLLAILAALPRFLETAGRFLVDFGRSPLFFYVVHLYIYAAIGLLYPGATSLAGMYPFWILGLVMLVPLCRRYDRFKRGKTETSIWRLF